MADEEEVQEIKTVTSYEATENNLKVIKTPDKIVPVTVSYDIPDIKNQIAKIDGAIELWQAKRKPLQDIIDKYTELNPVPKEE